MHGPGDSVRQCPSVGGKAMGLQSLGTTVAWTDGNKNGRFVFCVFFERPQVGRFYFWRGNKKTG